MAEWKPETTERPTCKQDRLYIEFNAPNTEYRSNVNCEPGVEP